MAREYFHMDEKRVLNRVLVVKELISDQEVYDKPCPLLKEQLNKLKVFSDQLQLDISKLNAIIESAKQIP